MNGVSVSVLIDASADDIWAELADLARHVEWMADARRIEFVTDSRSGVGTRMEVLTRIGPLRTTDVIEVTEWTPPRRMGVSHGGLVTGTGLFRLSPVAGGTRLTWSEWLTFPWWLGGPVAAWVARPVLGWVWRRNLDSLRSRVEVTT